MAALIVARWKLPWLSPKHFEVDSFPGAYTRLMLIAIALLAYLPAAILWIGAGHTAKVRTLVFSGVCLIFVLMGNVMGKVRRNFYIGVRTPWSLASERVWNATHRLAAKTFVLGVLVGLARIAANSALLEHRSLAGAAQNYGIKTPPDHRALPQGCQLGN